MRELPIGFLDSGFGGLTVVRESLKQLPNESIIYIGDSLRAPYGPRPIEEVRQFTQELTDFLLEQHIKFLVIACNTATAAMLDVLSRNCPVPVLGVIESGGKRAVQQTKNKKIGVIGTQGTIQSLLYPQIIHTIQPETQVFEKAVPKFVEIVEQQQIDAPSTAQIVNDELEEMKTFGIDTLILGCTHYPLLEEEIQQALGQEVTLIDSGAETVCELKKQLSQRNLLRTGEEQKYRPAFQRYYTTGQLAPFDYFARQMLNQEEIDVRRVTL